MLISCGALLLGSPRYSAQAQDGPSDPAELEAFLDAFFAETMHALHIPGAAVVVVKDGRPLLTKGYGYANLETKAPVDPAQTLFRAGSVTKLLTTTAILQLAEDGKIDLLADANTYLKRIQLPNQYARPITVTNLLTHTHGLDIPYIGMFSRTAEGVKPLDEFLAKELPAQVEPPGESYLYSNIGMTVAGLIVEEVTGVPYADYIQEHILNPLGMAHSTLQQPLPARLAPDLAVGYSFAPPDIYRPRPFTYVKHIPAGALTTSVTDMAPFLIALLEGGHYGETRILGEAVAQEMIKQQFAHHRLMPGTSFGLYESIRNGHRTLQHGGIVPGYVNLVFLFPEEHLGFFATGNQVGADVSVFEKLADAFVDRYYPEQAIPATQAPLSPAALAPTLSLAPDQLSRFEGIYRDEQIPRHSLLKLAIFAGWRSEYHVDPAKDGTLVLYPEQSTWAPIEPLTFRRVDDPERYIAFQADAQGNISHLITDEGVMRYRRIAWYEKMSLQWRLLRVFQLIFPIAPLLWMATFMVGRLRDRRRNTASPAPFPAGYRTADMNSPRKAHLAKLLAGTVCLLNIGFLAGVVVVLLYGDSWLLPYGMPLGIRALFVIPLLSVLLTLALPFFTALVWKEGYWTLVGRLFYTGVVLTALAFIPFLAYWNLLFVPL